METNTKYLDNLVEKTLLKQIFKFFYTYSYDMLFQFLRRRFFKKIFSISSYVAHHSGDHDDVNLHHLKMLIKTQVSAFLTNSFWKEFFFKMPTNF